MCSSDLIDYDAVGPLHLGVGILVVRRADNEARARALHEGPEHLARELDVVIHHEHWHVGKPGSKAGRYMSQMISAASAAVAVTRVGTACTFK